MIIAINTRILSGDETASKILIRWFENIAAENRQHQFYFISNQELQLSALSNVKSVVIKQQSFSPLLWKIWYNYTLPAVLKKIKADLLVSADGVCSLRTKIPQFVLVNELGFFNHPDYYNKRYVSFIKANMPLCCKKAARIITFSEAVKNDMVNRFAIEERKVLVSSFDTDKKFQPLSWDEKQQVKDTHTEGNEYFLFKGAIHSRANLTNLLKAFSLFKKRQKSSTQLVLVVDKIPVKDTFVESLRLYKYRNEVKLITGLGEEDGIALMASALCAIHLSPFYSDLHFLQSALSCEVPVIAGHTKQAEELLQGAALYADPLSIDSISTQLMLVYKDEKKQSELVQKGRQLPTSPPGKNAWEMIVSMAGAR